MALANISKMATRKDNIQIVIDIEAQAGIRAYQKLLDETKRVNQEMQKMKRAGKENSDEFKQLQKRAGELNGELTKLGGAGANMGQLINRSRELNRELKSLAPGTQRFIEVTKELKDVAQRLRDIRDQTKSVGQGMEEVRIAGIRLPDGMAKGVIGVQTAFKALFVLQVLQWFADLFRSIDETTKQFVKLRGGIQQFTNATGDDLDDYTSRLAGIATTFGKDNDEVLKAANALTKQLTGDFSQSLDLIEKGFLAGADRSGEFLDSLSEYPAFFREARLSGEDMIAVLAQSAQEGVFSDKGVDLVKEFTLRVREMPKATKAAFTAIGLDSAQVAKAIDEDGIGGAFTMVQKRLRMLEDDSPAVGQALADIFGGPGEDAGIQFIKQLDLTDEALNGLIDSSNTYTATLIDQLEANQELARAQNDVAKSFSDASGSLSIYITRVKTFLYDTAALVLQFFEQLPATAKGVGAAMRQIGQNISNFFQGLVLDLRILVKQAEKLNPFGKTSEQLNQEIAALRVQRNQLSEEGMSAAKAYREAYLEEMKNVEVRKEVAKVLPPPPEDKTIRTTAKATAERTAEIEAEELAKARAARAKQPGVVAALGTTSPTAGVASTGESEQDITAQEEILKNKFLRALVTEQEYEDRRYQMQQEAYTRRMEFLKERFGEESAAYLALENQKLEAQRTYEEQRQELTKRTEEVRQRVTEDGFQSLSQLTGGVIALLKSEEGERKKNATALKAFSIGKVLIDTREAIIAIIKNAEANPGNILFPGLSNIIAGAKIGGVLAQSAVAVNQIRKQGFYDGGFTGTSGLFRDNNNRKVVGAVHENEWVAPAWMTSHPQAGQMIGMLENMRKRGYQEGGFANFAGSTTPGSSGPDLNFLKDAVQQLARSQSEMTETIKRKQFSVMTGQVRDALDEDYRLERNASF